MYCNTNVCTDQQTLPAETNYFKEEIVEEILTIPSQKPDIERILDIMVWPKLVNVELVETQIGMSNEGQYLSGYKLVAEVNLTEKVTYVACEPTQSVYAAHFETLKSMFIVIPTELDGKNICDLFRRNKIQVTPYVEATHFRMLDCRNIYKCVMLFLDAKIC